MKLERLVKHYITFQHLITSASMDTALLITETLSKEATIPLQWHVQWIQNVRRFVTARKMDLVSYVPIMMQRKNMTIGSFVSWIQVRNCSSVFASVSNLITIILNN